jgi:hypothetical protein
MLESLFFYSILTTYQRWFSENFVRIGSKLTWKIGFEKFGKNTDFWKSQKKFGRNGKSDNLFLIFSEHLGPKERRVGETW